MSEEKVDKGLLELRANLKREIEDLERQEGELEARRQSNLKAQQGAVAAIRDTCAKLDKVRTELAKKRKQKIVKARPIPAEVGAST